MSEAIQAYCVKCKAKREMVNPIAVYNTNGTPGTRGTCSVCSTTLFRMGATEAHATLPKPEKVTRAAPKKTASKTTKSKAKSKTKAKSKKTVAKAAPKKTGG